MASPSNLELAAALDEISERLQSHGASHFRVRAYHEAAQSVREQRRPIAEIARAGGVAALVRLPAIGEGIASLLIDALSTGRVAMLERLRGEGSPEEVFAAVPGIGPTLAARIHERLGIETLEELEVAAHDGRLLALPGFGSRRVEGLRATLDALLRHRRRPPSERPPLATLLAVDAEYRRLAAAGRLRKIAPRRFNPRHEAWLPIWHETRDGWDFDVLYSNSARAHELGRTDDWVVIYWSRGPTSGQSTAVTEHHGPNAGRRVIRGREAEPAPATAPLSPPQP